MNTCVFCHAQIPAHASFCGSCGRSQTETASSPITDLPTSQLTSDDEHSAILAHSDDDKQPDVEEDHNTILDHSAEEDEPAKLLAQSPNDDEHATILDHSAEEENHKTILDHSAEEEDHKTVLDHSAEEEDHKTVLDHNAEEEHKTVLAQSPDNDEHATIMASSDEDKEHSVEDLPTAQLSIDHVATMALDPVSELHTLEAQQAVTMISQHNSADYSSGADEQTFFSSINDAPTTISPVAIPNGEIDEDEEEKKRRLLLLGLAAPVVGAALLPDGNGNQAAMLPGHLHYNAALKIPDLNAPAGNRSGDALAHSGHSMQPVSQPGFQPPPNLTVPAFSDPAPLLAPPGGPVSLPGGPILSPPGGSSPGSLPGGSKPAGGSTGASSGASGCLPWLIISVIIMIIFGSIFGLSVTVFAPNLTLTGNSIVKTGSSFQLQGSGFLPDTNISLTLDDSRPLYFVYQSQQTGVASFTTLSFASTHLPATIRLRHTLTTNGNGSFTIAIQVGQDWKPGQHTIKATETLSSRSATRTIKVENPTLIDTSTPVDQTPGATSTVTATASVSPTATDTPTATATSQPSPGTTITPSPQLDSISPASVALTVGEGANQSVSTSVTLTTAGTGTVSWSASWNQQQGAWLQLSTASGQLQAPSSLPITILANPTGLAIGTYNATVTFASQQSNATVKLTVSLKVQAGCINASPTALTFNGTAFSANPAPQTLQLKNCGLVTPWTGSVASGNWLSIDPTSGSMDAGGTQTVTVSVSPLNKELKAGTYSGSLTFTNGSTQISVPVTLNLAAPPTLTATPTALDVKTSSQCPYNANKGGYTCTVTLSSNASAKSDLHWSSSVSGSTAVTVTPTSGTLTPGSSTAVSIYYPDSICGISSTVSFSGPSNTVSVVLSCTNIIR